MVDPKSTMAGANGLVTVLVFVGTQLSPTTMVRKAVKKELKVAAILREHGSIISQDDWKRISALQDEADVAKAAVTGTKWRDVFRHPIKLIVHARGYYSATDYCLFEARAASARALITQARTAANHPPAAAGDPEPHNPPPSPPPTAQSEGHDQLDTTGAPDVLFDEGTPSYDSTPQIEDAFTTRFDNVLVHAGGCVRITLHFGVGDVPVLVNPDEHIAEKPASYTGPIILSGYAKLLPNDGYNLKHPPQVFIGHYKSGYDLEFSNIRWRSPQDPAPGMSGFMDDDRVSLASLEATYGGDRATIREFNEDERREMLHRLQAAVSSG